MGTASIRDTRTITATMVEGTAHVVVVVTLGSGVVVAAEEGEGEEGGGEAVAVVNAKFYEVQKRARLTLLVVL